MAETVVDLLQEASSHCDRGYTFLDDQLQPEYLSFKDLATEAMRFGRGLRSRGLRKGDRVALIVPDAKAFVLSFLGAISEGIVPVPMYPPFALDRLDAYIETTARILETSGSRMLVTSKRIGQVLGSLLVRVPTLEELLPAERLPDDAAADGGGVEIEPTDLCFLQFTSGATADPKGVGVSHRNLVANSRAIMIHGLGVDPPIDRAISWLPLYHDMGLIGFVIAPLLTATPSVFIPPTSFVKHPSVWMECISRFRGTLTFAPNFAFGLATRHATPERVAALDLRGLRVVGCGAELINPKTMRAFIEAFEPAGLDPKAVMPSYGMAEATLAISFADRSQPIRSLTLDRHPYEERGLVRVIEDGSTDASLTFVGCGRAFPDHEIGIVADGGEMLGEGEVGEIVFRGPSVTAGYVGKPDATKELLRDGWLHTGDLGFTFDGELFVSGRKKELIIIHGRNHHPQSIEWLVEGVEGIRKGNVIAFPQRGEETEELVIVAESRRADVESLSREVARCVKAALGIVVRDVLIVPPGSLPKTSSGKLQRSRAQAQYESGSLGRLGNRTLGSRARALVLARHVTASAVARVRHRIRELAGSRGSRQR